MIEFNVLIQKLKARNMRINLTQTDIEKALGKYKVMHCGKPNYKIYFDSIDAVVQHLDELDIKDTPTELVIG